MKRGTGWLIAGSVVVGGVITYLIVRKLSGSKQLTSNSQELPPGATSVDNPVNNPVNTTGSKKVYSKRGLTIRETPEIDDGFLWMGGNRIKIIGDDGVLVGTWNGAAPVPDTDGDINPVTAKTFMFYPITLNANVGGPGTFYVREDYVTFK